MTCRSKPVAEQGTESKSPDSQASALMSGSSSMHMDFPYCLPGSKCFICGEQPGCTMGNLFPDDSLFGTDLPPHSVPPNRVSLGISMVASESVHIVNKVCCH